MRLTRLQKQKQDEAISINYTKKTQTDGQQVLSNERYMRLISSTFKWGPYAFSSPVSWVEMATFGPVESNGKFVKGRYITLIANYNLGPRKRTGYITHFLVTNAPVKSLKKAGKDGWTADGKTMFPVPADFNSIKQVVALIEGVGYFHSTDAPDADSTGESKDMPVFDINKRFELMVKLVKLVGLKAAAGIIITGTGGLGKTYTVMGVINKLGLKEGTDYLYIKGAKLTTVAFYQTIHDNRDKLIIFDDSDSFLDNGDVKNMLKSALDTSGVRTLEYYSPAVENAGLDPKFDFTGQIIFISNRTPNQIDQPLISRSLMVDVTMSREEALERMEFIAAKGPPDGVAVSPESMMVAFNFMKDFILTGPGAKNGRPKDLNMRTLIKLAVVRESDPDDFADLGLYMLMIG